MAPKRFPVCTKARKDSLRTLHVDVSRFRINRGTGSGVTDVYRVAEIIVVEVLPGHFAGFGVEAGNTFLHISPLAKISHGVNSTVGNHRGGLPREICAP